MLKTIYRDVFKEVYPRIKNKRHGVLYTLIHILLERNQSQADSICRCIDIRENDSKEQDRKVVDDLMSNPEENILYQIFSDREKVELFWIVVIACSLVGVYGCVRYLREQKEKNRQKQVSEAVGMQQAPLPSKPVTAALCLVVPAHSIANLGDVLTARSLEQLIDSASYFLCTTIDNANLKQQSLGMTDEDIPLDSNRDVYIRIHISNGQEIIDKKAKYILKRNLPSDAQAPVQMFACLESLSGLEEFNRV